MSQPDQLSKSKGEADSVVQIENLSTMMYMQRHIQERSDDHAATAVTFRAS